MVSQSQNSRTPSPKPPNIDANALTSPKKQRKDQKKSNAKANAKGESTTKANAAGRLACDICRERKVRCDRADPKCGRCTRLDHDCSYHGRARHKSSQADLPRQLSELQDRLARAEAILVPLNLTSTARDLHNAADFPWQFMSPHPHEPYVDHEGANLLQSHVTSIDPGFDGFDLLTNLTEEAQDSCINDFDWTSMAAPIPEILPLQESPELHTPMELCDLSTDPISVPQDFVPHALSSRSLVDEEVSSQDMTLLHHNYFEIFYPVIPILSKRRFFAEWTRDPSSLPIWSLSYAVALVGTTISANYAHLQQSCYSEARKYVELCERDEDGADLASLNVFKVLLFIIRYELTSKRFTRAWMTMGRAITLAKMMNLYQMDSANSGGAGTSDPEIRLPPLKDPASLEEMRRSFWTLYIFESYASVRTGRLFPLAEAQMHIFLPSPDQLTEDFAPVPMPFLSEASKLCGVSHISSYVAVVLMVRLARLCFDHVSLLTSDTHNKGFWDRHYALVKHIDDYTAIKRMHLSVQAVREDPLAFSLHMNLYAVHIFLHEAAIGQVDEQELRKLVGAESRKCSTDAAFKIASVIRMTWPTQRSERDFFTLQATFIGWPLAMSMKALSRSLLDSENITSISIADILRLLIAALDQVEEPDGYWHKASVGAVATLEKWDEKQGGFQVGSLNARRALPSNG